jgi:signal transduction histidine kinase/ligand-binding sensor domain-containing protein
MSMKRLAIACAWLLLGGALSENARAFRTIVSTESPYIVDVWDIKDGLPDSAILSLAQTREGYLWAGTLNGLVRFDGMKFTLFVEANTPGLNSSRIAHLFEDSRGNLWLGTEGAGVAMIDRDGGIRSFDLGRGNREGRLVATCEAAPGEIWMATENGLLGHYRDGKLDVSEASGAKWLLMEKGQLLVGFAVGLFARQEPTNGMVAFVQAAPVNSRLDYVLASRTGGYWMLADGRVQKIRNGQRERDLGTYLWGTAPVSAACEDAQGNLVVGTLGDGVYWFDATGNYTHLSAELSHPFILSLVVDREGNLWIGTNGGGLDRVKRSAFRVLAGSEGKVVQSVAEDNQGGLWVAYNGNRIDYLRSTNEHQFGLHQDPQGVYAKSVFVDRNQHVWAGFQVPYGSGLFYFNINNRSFQEVPSVIAPYQTVSVIFQDRAGALWIGTQTGAARWDDNELRLLTAEKGLPGNEVRAIAEGLKDEMWIATGAGLARLDGTNISVFHKKDGLPSDDLSCLWMDNDGVLWIGTRGSGLARFDGKKWTRFTMAEGLSGNSIGYLIEDGKTNLWIGSNVGLMRADKASLNKFAAGLAESIVCRTYVEADGLYSRQCTQGSQPAACLSTNGTLWFPTTWGLVSLDPGALSKNEYLPPVIIEAVLVEGEQQASSALRPGATSKVILSPGRQHVEIRYTSLNLGSAERSRFKYRLNPHDKNWTEDDGHVRVARYNRLPPGEYKFEVMAANEDGVWNPTAATLAIYVQPPFWRTIWFIGVASLLFVGTIVLVVHYFSTQKLQRQLAVLRQQEELERERARIARDLHDQLGANLTQVALLGELAETDKSLPDEVESHARQISQTARETTKSLDEIVWAVNPSNDTLDGLINYICKYAQEYFELAGIRYRLEVPAQLPKRSLPPDVRHNVFLAAKEAINNVVKHAKASTARLRLNLRADHFVLEIEDDGRGLPPGAEVTGRNGLRNMRRRLEDTGGTFSITPAAERGTVVRLTVPIKDH